VFDWLPCNRNRQHAVTIAAGSFTFVFVLLSAKKNGGWFDGLYRQNDKRAKTLILSFVSLSHSWPATTKAKRGSSASD
jgi:hypothetical protein